jgi:glycosyltransferase involved in cell wall biosynthesis
LLADDRVVHSDAQDEPFVSFLLPAYNAEGTVVQAIDSVLSQSGAPFELVVVDDGSTDDTAGRVLEAIKGDARARLIRQENQGTGGALRTAIEHAKGQWFIMLGADDWLSSNSLERRIAFMQANPGYAIYSTAFYYVYDNETQELFPDWDTARSVTFEQEIEFPWINGLSLFSRKAYEATGGFDSRFYNEDYDLWLRMLLHGYRHIFQPEPLAYYRIHSNQKTHDIIKQRRGDIEIFENLLISGLLDGAQAKLVKATIKKFERNSAFRKALYRLIGRNNTEKLIAKVYR